MTPRRSWLLAIAGLLAANVIAMVVLAVAANDGATQVIPAYYDKAAHYDDELDRAEASRRLGWHAEVSIANGAIDVVMSDASGAPVDGATVRVTGYQRAHAAEALDLALPASQPGGHYRGPVGSRPGWHDLTVSAERGGARYLQHVAIEAR
ncbi:MAG TPA: FixH family protein [Kofleriaceae bacterium]|nr:FixH family protein [Kofleriaceae bacterium]